MRKRQAEHSIHEVSSGVEISHHPINKYFFAASVGDCKFLRFLLDDGVDLFSLNHEVGSKFYALLWG